MLNTSDSHCFSNCDRRSQRAGTGGTAAEREEERKRRCESAVKDEGSGGVRRMIRWRNQQTLLAGWPLARTRSCWVWRMCVKTSPPSSAPVTKMATIKPALSRWVPIPPPPAAAAASSR